MPTNQSLRNSDTQLIDLQASNWLLIDKLPVRGIVSTLMSSSFRL